MNPRAIFTFILFYIIPLVLFGSGLYLRNLPLELVGLIWLISAFILSLMAE
ncbi:MAG: hypothetical protein QW078_04855 [Thermoplasmatales archaeon]